MIHNTKQCKKPHLWLRIMFLLIRLCYLVPVLTGVVNLFNRAWLKNINKSVKKEKNNKMPICEASDAMILQVNTFPTTHSHKRTPSFRLSIKLSPILLPVTSSIQSLNSSSFWESYFAAS